MSRRYLRSPLTGLVVLGSNGEAPQLEEHEADLAITTVRDAMPKDRPLLAGTGRESTAATIAATERAAGVRRRCRDGAHTVLLQGPDDDGCVRPALTRRSPIDRRCRCFSTT